MYFCPSCSYSFDIVKSSSIGEKDNRIQIEKLSEALKKFDEGADFTKYVATFSRDDTNKNKRYQKLDEAQKAIFNQIFEEITSGGAEFKCNNCNNIEPIKKTILLYNIDMEEKIVKLRTLEENEFICQDPILPRTQDYTCKNPKCITHKNTKAKEAVFFKEKNSFKVNYICTVCYYAT